MLSLNSESKMVVREFYESQSIRTVQKMHTREPALTSRWTSTTINNKTICRNGVVVLVAILIILWSTCYNYCYTEMYYIYIYIYINQGLLFYVVLGLNGQLKFIVHCSYPIPSLHLGPKKCCTQVVLVLFSHLYSTMGPFILSAAPPES